MASLTSIGTVSKREIHCQSDKHCNFFKEGFIVSLKYIGTVSKREIYYKSNKECNIQRGRFIVSLTKSATFSKVALRKFLRYIFWFHSAS